MIANLINLAIYTPIISQNRQKIKETRLFTGLPFIFSKNL